MRHGLLDEEDPFLGEVAVASLAAASAVVYDDQKCMMRNIKNI